MMGMGIVEYLLGWLLDCLPLPHIIENYLYFVKASYFDLSVWCVHLNEQLEHNLSLSNGFIGI